MKKNLFLVGIFCLATFAACEPDRRTAQNTGYEDVEDGAESGLGEDQTIDREFLADAASGNMMEVELGRIAQEKATRKEVKDFAAMMVKDHSEANDRLKTIAQNKNIQLPQQMKEDQQEKVKKFRDMKAGKEFDKEYVNLMVEDHEEDVSLFEDKQNDIKDPEIKQWADNTLQTLRKHKQRIEEIKNNMEKKS